MLTLEHYAGPWARSTDWHAACQRNASGRLLPAVNTLVARAQADGVQFPINPATQSIVSGTRYGGFRPQSCLIGAPHSNHKLALAVDLYDPINDIDAWCMANLGVLSECGIWIEHPSATSGWSHWQCVPPRSGRRVFHP